MHLCRNVKRPLKQHLDKGHRRKPFSTDIYNAYIDANGNANPNFESQAANNTNTTSSSIDSCSFKNIYKASKIVLQY